MTDELLAGTAVIDITPTDLIGLNAMGPDFESVHDRLFVRALVLSRGETQLAVVSIDQLEIGTTVDLRAEIEATTRIPASHVLIAPTHSHNAPRAGRTPEGGLSRAPSAESLARTALTFAAIVEAVGAAQAQQVPARLAVGRGVVDVNTNRNVLVDGTWALGIAPDGPSDKTVTVLAIDDLAGDAIATAFVYSVHPTVALGIRALSADLAGATVREVASQRGGVALWLAGSIGDQAPRSSFDTLRAGGQLPSADDVFAAVDVQADAIAAEVVRVAAALRVWSVSPALASAERQVCVGSHRGTGLPPDMPQSDSAEACVRLIAMSIGELRIAGVGGEVTVPGADVLQAAAPGAVVVSIANERMGYLADPRAFELGQFAARGCPVQPGWLTASFDAFADMFARQGSEK